MTDPRTSQPTSFPDEPQQPSPSLMANMRTKLLELKHAGPHITGDTDHPIRYPKDPSSPLWQRQLHHGRAREGADQARPKEQLALRPLARDVNVAGKDNPLPFAPEFRNPLFIEPAALAKLIPVTGHLVFALEQCGKPSRQLRWQVLVNKELQAALRSW